MRMDGADGPDEEDGDRVDKPGTDVCVGVQRDLAEGLEPLDLRTVGQEDTTNDSGGASDGKDTREGATAWELALSRGVET